MGVGEQRRASGDVVRPNLRRRASAGQCVSDTDSRSKCSYGHAASRDADRFTDGCASHASGGFGNLGCHRSDGGDAIGDCSTNGLADAATHASTFIYSASCADCRRVTAKRRDHIASGFVCGLWRHRAGAGRMAGDAETQGSVRQWSGD
jgi:hypothetical protein